MSIRKIDDGYLVECDDCSYTETIEEQKYFHAINQIKKNGWKASIVGRKAWGTIWNHKCPICQEKKAKVTINAKN